MSQQPVTQVVVQGPGPLSRMIHWLGWMGFAICAMLLIRWGIARSEYLDRSRGVQERLFSGDGAARDKVAIIHLRGVIMSGEGFTRDQIERIRHDDSVKAVVLRVNSPGGTIAGSDYLFHHLTRLREEKQIPLVVSMGSIAASGGYYAAMAVGDQADSIFAEPTTNTGSIGVVIPHYDISGLLDRIGVEDTSIATHPRKLMLNMTRPLGEDERQLAQSYVDQSLRRFLDVIKQGRPKLAQEDATIMVDGRNLATGEVFMGVDALKYGLVDRLGFIEEAIDRAIELAGLNKDATRVVEYGRLSGLLDLNQLLGVPAARVEDELWQWTTPSGFYICTTDPAAFAILRAAAVPTLAQQLFE